MVMKAAMQHPLTPIFSRAFSQVTLVAWNVANVSQHRYAMAFVSGTLLSFIWWKNSKTAAHTDVEWAREAYALGAGFGTIAGMILGRYL